MRNKNIESRNQNKKTEIFGRIWTIIIEPYE